MADSGARTRELVFCHACHTEWLKDRDGLQCPECHSDAVEIIDETSDPRGNHIRDRHNENATVNNDSNESIPTHPLQHHNPWTQADVPGSDEPNIEHVEWNPAPGVHFARTSYRSTTSQMGPQGRPQDDPFGPFFQSFSTMLEGVSNAQGRPLGQAPPRNMQRMNGPRHVHPVFTTQNPFPDYHHHIHQHHHNGPWTPGEAGGRNIFTATGRWPPAGPAAFPNAQHGNPAHNVLATLLQTMQANIAQQNPNNPGMGAMPGFLSQILGAGSHGDAVYTDEALDRVITQMMEQNGSNNAPGPASAEAIARLPKKTVDKAMMGQEGKAECSVCMDTVEIGDQVTELPCRHWFHGECVGAWLKEHDTCPHCRQGIMPRESREESRTPRSPHEAPRHSQNPLFIPNLENHGQHHPSTAGQPYGPAMRRPGPPSPLPPSPIFSQAPPTGPFPQPGPQQPYMPGSFPNYPEPHNHIFPPGQVAANLSSRPPSQYSRAQDGQHRLRPSASRRSSRSSGNGGEGNSNGVTGWFRNLRGGSGNGNR